MTDKKYDTIVAFAAVAVGMLLLVAANFIGWSATSLLSGVILLLAAAARPLFHKDDSETKHQPN